MSRSANDRRRRQVEDRYFGYDDYDRDSNRKSKKNKKSDRLALDSGVTLWKRPNVSRHDIDEFYDD